VAHVVFAAIGRDWQSSPLSFQKTAVHQLTGKIRMTFVIAVNLRSNYQFSLQGAPVSPPSRWATAGLQRAVTKNDFPGAMEALRRGASAAQVLGRSGPETGPDMRAFLEASTKIQRLGLGAVRYSPVHDPLLALAAVRRGDQRGVPQDPVVRLLSEFRVADALQSASPQQSEGALDTPWAQSASRVVGVVLTPEMALLPTRDELAATSDPDAQAALLKTGQQALATYYARGVSHVIHDFVTLALSSQLSQQDLLAVLDVRDENGAPLLPQALVNDDTGCYAVEAFTRAVCNSARSDADKLACLRLMCARSLSGAPSMSVATALTADNHEVVTDFLDIVLGSDMSPASKAQVLQEALFSPESPEDLVQANPALWAHVTVRAVQILGPVGAGPLLNSPSNAVTTALMRPDDGLMLAALQAHLQAQQASDPEAVRALVIQALAGTQPGRMSSINFDREATHIEIAFVRNPAWQEWPALGARLAAFLDAMGLTADVMPLVYIPRAK
jgi:hypothetical protein